MKHIIIIGLFLLISCDDFSILEKDQENVFFFQNHTSVNPPFSGQLSIATFNIKMGYCQNCNPFSGEIGGSYKQLDQIAELINSLDIDIVALQEVGLDYDATIVQNQAEYLANKTNMNVAYGMHRALQDANILFLNGFLGNTILSKYEISALENPAIRYIDYYNQNRVLKATIKLTEGMEIMVLNAHFASGSTDQERLNQINSIQNVVKQESLPYLFMGDLNIPYIGGNEELSKLDELFDNSLNIITQAEREAVLTNGTFVNGSVLDYIFTDQTHFNIQSGGLAPMESWGISDHYLYVVEVVVQ